METKKCVVCGKELPLSKFPSNKKVDGSLSYRDKCISCCNEQQREKKKLIEDERKRKEKAINDSVFVMTCETNLLIAELLTRGYSVNKIKEEKDYEND